MMRTKVHVLTASAMLLSATVFAGAASAQAPDAAVRQPEFRQEGQPRAPRSIEHARPMPVDPNDVFDQMDRNHDDRVSREEFLAFHDRRQAPRPPRGGPSAFRGPQPPDAPHYQGQGETRVGPGAQRPDARLGRGPRNFPNRQEPGPRPVDRDFRGENPSRDVRVQPQERPRVPPPSPEADSRPPAPRHRIEPHEIFIRMDANGDGVVTEEELLAFHRNRPGFDENDGAPDDDRGAFSPRSDRPQPAPRPNDG